jgi:hypothetical protein
MNTNVWIMIGVIAAGALLPACSKSYSPTGAALSLGDFSDQQLSTQQQPTVEGTNTALTMAGLGARPTPRLMPQRPEEFSTFFDVNAQIGSPVIVDSLIGQVNGQPIYADEVLAPLMDRLQATYEEQSYPAFVQQMKSLVSQQLNSFVQNELIVAESRAGLSDQEQTGLIAYVETIRQDAVRKRGGSEHEAARRLMEEEGKTIDEYIDGERQKLLIGELLREKVTPKTLVAWRDIERAYRSQIDTFQPKATATLGRIRIKTAGNEERIKLIDQELDAGVTFITVAKQAKMPKDGVWQTFQLPEGGLEDISLNEFYKPYLKQIQDGGTTGSFERGSWTMWISLLEVMRPTARSLDEPDVQRMLQNQLMRDRSQRAEWEYVNGLLQRGIHDEIGAMVNRALLIAISRFPPK